MIKKLGIKSPIFILSLFLILTSVFGHISRANQVTDSRPSVQKSEDTQVINSANSRVENKQSLNPIENSSSSLVVSEDEISKIWEILNQKKSFQKRQWKKLLHFENDALLRQRSQVSDPSFFLSPDGYKNPETEMLLTLESYFWKENQLADLYKVDKNDKNQILQHPLCKFPARLKYIKKETSGHPLWLKLPEVNCHYLDLFTKSLNAKSISFVFSSYYADSPGSAFGHTFFRVNKKEREGVKKQELLDYGISFAANVTTENTLLYAIFGLTGGFTGTYTNVPYYYKVREYNDFESRDLWSYELALTDEELELLILHFWEVGSHYFTYYFFTQNCSYQMLTALEAAAPRLYLSESLPIFIIPADSVKVLFKEKDFVKNVEFRPSLKRQFDARYNKLNPIEKDIFLSFVKTRKMDSKYSELNEERKSILVDTALDYADLKDPHGIANRKGEWFEFKEQNLITRSKIDFISEELNIVTPEKERPDSSHASSRLAFGGGEEKQTHHKKLFFEFRFALHDLMDSKIGLPKYSQLEFGNFKLSNQVNSIYVDHFSFFRVRQMNPLTALEKKLSWSLDVGFKRFNFCDSRLDCFGSGLKAMVGYSADWENILIWAMPVLEYRYGEYFDQERHRYAYGINAGLIYNINDQHRLQYYHEKQKFNLNQELEDNYFEYRYNFSSDKSLSLIADQEHYKTILYFYF
jgi:hypothetical protein